MHVDLYTLYLLVIGTLLASAGMTYWEYRTNAKRGRSLGLLAAGFATIAAGCTVTLLRGSLPAALGPGLSNLLILGGYLLVLQGVAAFNDRRYRAGPIALLIVMAVIWIVAGTRWQGVVWSYVSAAPIAAVAALTAWEMWRCAPLKALAPRRFVVAITGIHALFYAFRALLLPWLVSLYGASAQLAASNITMYEGVLYSVLLPMALLKLVREEAHGQLVRESQTDYLTRLGNRRWFFEEGARLLRAHGAQGPVAVLAFDLDHFKSINDRHGHQAGDQVLKVFADIAQEVAGPNVLLARIGGEEFAALLMGDAARQAQSLGESVARRFAGTASERADRSEIRATVSIGLARFDDNAPPLADSLAAADRALYRAKSLGGNRLEVA
ncbi:diguanylate cyclase [Achromobacter piechaudii]|uniref:GGDEF domain-containing protein n=1 Tax=Achromobacter piechaudii TaxID=72556 RepID=UPI003DA81050